MREMRERSKSVEYRENVPRVTSPAEARAVRKPRARASAERPAKASRRSAQAARASTGGDEAETRGADEVGQPEQHDEAEDVDDAQEPVTDNPIFVALSSSGSAVSALADEWLDRVRTEPRGALLELFNFAMSLSGIFLQVVAGVDPYEMEMGKVLEQMVEEAKGGENLVIAGNGLRYPLAFSGGRGSRFRRLRPNVADFLKALLLSATEHGMLENSEAEEEEGEGPDAGRASPVNWLAALVLRMASTQMHARAVRHSGTFLLLRLLDGALHARAETLKQLETDRKQLEGFGAKAGKGKGGAKRGAGAGATSAPPNVAALKADMAARERSADALGTLAARLFDQGFVERYRDVAEAVRVDCVAALSGWALRAPDLFFNNPHIKYLGWMLSDEEAGVRAAAADAVCELVCAEHADKLKAFLGRFAPRVVQMTDDVDAGARASALKLVAAIARLGLLPGASRERLDFPALVNDADGAVRALAMALMIELPAGGAKDAAGAEGAGASKGSAKKKGSPALKTRLRDLASSLHRLTRASADGGGAEPLPPTVGIDNTADSWASGARAERVKELFLDAAKGQKDLNSLDAIADVILAARADDDDDERAEGADDFAVDGGGADGPRADSDEAAGIDCVLLCMLDAALDSAVKAAKGGARARSADKQDERRQALDQLHTSLARRLPALLDGSRAHAGASAAACSLVCKLPVGVFAERGLRKPFAATVEALERTYNALTPDYALVACARAWATLCADGHTFSSEARVSLARLAERVGSAVEAIAAAGGGGGGGGGGGKGGAKGRKARKSAAGASDGGGAIADYESAVVSLRRLRVLCTHCPLGPGASAWAPCAALLRAELDASAERMRVGKYDVYAVDVLVAQCAIELAHTLRSLLLDELFNASSRPAATPRSAKPASRGRAPKRRSPGSAAEEEEEGGEEEEAAGGGAASGAVEGELREHLDELLELLSALVSESGPCASSTALVDALELSADVLVGFCTAHARVQPLQPPAALVGALSSSAWYAFDESEIQAAAAAEHAAEHRAAAPPDGALGAQLRERVVLLLAKLAHRRAAPPEQLLPTVLHALRVPTEDPSALLARRFWHLAQSTLAVDEVRAVELRALELELDAAPGDEGATDARSLFNCLREQQRTAAAHTENDDPDEPAAATPARSRTSASRSAWAADVVVRAARLAIERSVESVEAAERADGDAHGDAPLARALRLLEDVAMHVLGKLPADVRGRVADEVERARDAADPELPAQLFVQLDLLIATGRAKERAATPGRRSSAGSARRARPAQSLAEEVDADAGPVAMGMGDEDPLARPTSEPLPDNVLDEEPDERVGGTEEVGSGRKSKRSRPARAQEPSAREMRAGARGTSRSKRQKESEPEEEDDAPDDDPPPAKAGGGRALRTRAAAPTQARGASQAQDEDMDAEDEAEKDEENEDGEEDEQEPEAAGAAGEAEDEESDLDSEDRMLLQPRQPMRRY